MFLVTKTIDTYTFSVFNGTITFWIYRKANLFHDKLLTNAFSVCVIEFGFLETEFECLI